MSTTFTVCFSGTDCTRDEGEKSREGAPHECYHPRTGSIPVRMHLEINDKTIDEKYKPGTSKFISEMTKDSHTVRGVASNDDFLGFENETLDFSHLDYGKDDPDGILAYVSQYGQDKFADENLTPEKIMGKSMIALALHGANLAAKAIKDGKKKIVFIGFSRGGVSCIAAASLLYYYGTPEMKKIPVCIFAIDPVPGLGEWYSLFTQLTPNVERYVGVYAWDYLKIGFSPVVPTPHKNMYIDLTPKKGSGDWKTIGDGYKGNDPLVASNGSFTTTFEAGQPKGYDIYLCRGGHGTLSGNYTTDSGVDVKKVDKDIAAVPKLVYLMARAHLKSWGVQFAAKNPSVQTPVDELRETINKNSQKFTDIRSFWNWTGNRNVDSRSGTWGTKYSLPDLVGPVPDGMDYPMPSVRHQVSTAKAWVDWNWL